MKRTVTVVLHADRHRDDARTFAEAYELEVPDGSLPDVLRAAYYRLCGVVSEHARVTLTISEPFT